MAERRVWLSDSSADLEGEDVAHQGLVSVIADQRPLLCRCRRAERALLLVELKPVRLLLEVPAGVSAAADLGAAGGKKLSSVL